MRRRSVFAFALAVAPLLALAAWPGSVQAGKARLMRRFPQGTWLPLATGHNTPHDLHIDYGDPNLQNPPTDPYAFVAPIGGKATIVFEAENFDSIWNAHRLDDVYVVEKLALPGYEGRPLQLEMSPYFLIDDTSYSPTDIWQEACPNPNLFQQYCPRILRFDSAQIPPGRIAFADNLSTSLLKPEWGPHTPPAGVTWLGADSAERLVFFENFESGLPAGWSLSGLWRVGSDCFDHSSPQSTLQLLFSRSSNCDYDVGGVIGQAVSPTIDLSNAVSASISLLEQVRVSGLGTTEMLRIEARSSPQEAWQLVHQASDQDFYSRFTHLDDGVVDISSLASSQFQFRLLFDSPFPGASGFTGWAVDDVSVSASFGGGSLSLGQDPQTSPGAPPTVIARLNLSNLKPGVEYAVFAKWNAKDGNGNPLDDDLYMRKLSIDVLFDSTSPTNAVAASTSHSTGVWSTQNTIAMQWSGGVDEVGGTGLQGYSWSFDGSPTTTPDATVDTPHEADPHTVQSSALSDGGNYYFHLRTCDNANNCSAPAHRGPFRIDTTAPGTPTGLMSSSHTAGVPSANRIIDIAWSPAIDASSGVDGYAYAFDNSATWVCDRVKRLEETGLVTHSPVLVDGTWYFHTCTKDNAGNWSTVASAGPFLITKIADLGVTMTDGLAVALPGQAVTYIITAANSGPNDALQATVLDTFPATLAQIAWTCTATGGSGCPSSGSGNINVKVDLPVGGKVTFVAEGILGVAATGTLSNTASVVLPTGLADPDPANNSATDVDPIKRALLFYTLAPCRIIDTRQAQGALGGPALPAQATRVFDLAGQCGVPSTAKAVSVNLTVTNPTGNGDIRLYAEGVAPLASSSNYSAGQTRANNAIVPLGTGARLAAHSDQLTGTVDLILDVNGYLE